MRSTDKKILLVDDDPDFRRATAMILKTHGFEIVEASSGKEGLEKALSEAFDLIIIDIIMESFSEGFKLVKKLTGSERTKDVPRIIMSTLGIQQDLDMIHPEELGTSSILQKPVKKEELLSVIESALV